MKILLTILCVGMALFGGGCALLASSYVGIVGLVPFVILVLNGLILAGLWGWQNPWWPAFYILGIADLLITAAVLFALAAYTTSGDPTTVWAIAAAGGFALKGILTLQYARAGGKAPGV